MSANAKARMAVEEAERLTRQAVEDAEQDRADQERCRADFEAGPPCVDCYVWVRDWFNSRRWVWIHRGIETGDQTCYHDCHDGEPYWCGPIAIA